MATEVSSTPTQVLLPPSPLQGLDPTFLTSDSKDHPPLSSPGLNTSTQNVTTQGCLLWKVVQPLMPY